MSNIGNIANENCNIGSYNCLRIGESLRLPTYEGAAAMISDKLTGNARHHSQGKNISNYILSKEITQDAVDCEF